MFDKYTLSTTKGCRIQSPPPFVAFHYCQSSNCIRMSTFPLTATPLTQPALHQLCAEKEAGNFPSSYSPSLELVLSCDVSVLWYTIQAGYFLVTCSIWTSTYLEPIFAYSPFTVHSSVVKKVSSRCPESEPVGYFLVTCTIWPSWLGTQWFLTHMPLAVYPPWSRTCSQ